MVNRALHGYLQEVQWRISHLPRRVQNEILAGIVATLEERAVALQRATPGLSREEATARAASEFCPAEEILVAYGPDGGVVRRTTGKVVLRSPALVHPGSGPKATFAWTGMAAAGAFVLVALLAFAVFTSLTDDAPQETLGTGGKTLWSADRTMAGLIGSESGSFTVGATGAVFTAASDATEGCVTLSVSSGTAIVYDSGDGCFDLDVRLELDEGDYTVTLSFRAFTGTVRAAAVSA